MTSSAFAIGQRQPRPRVLAICVAAIVAVAVVMIAFTVSATNADYDRGDVTDVVDRYDRALVLHDWSALDELVAPEFTLNNLTFGTTQGRIGFLAWAREFGDSYPDFFVSVDRVDVTGQVALVRFHEDGRSAAHRPGVCASDVAGLFWVSVAGGQIVAIWSNYEEFGALRNRCPDPRQADSAPPAGDELALREFGGVL